MLLPKTNTHCVFVGLGNPGSKYEKTRHNIGFMVVKDFARKMGWSFKEERQFSAFVAKGLVGDVMVHLLLPTTYMNLSGMAVRAYLDYFKLGLDCLVVINDDVAFPFGQMRLKSMGSAGGHNGLKSIESHLGSSLYVRLRMGVGSPQKTEELADYVLASFNAEETAALVTFVDRATQILRSLLTETVSNVMNAVNAKIELKQPPTTGEEKRDESKQTKPL